MSAFSDYLEQGLLIATLRGGEYEGTDVYVALFETDPTDAATGTETSYDDYARVLCGSSAGSPATGFDAPAVDGTGYKCVNSRLLEFPPVGTGTSEVTISHWALFDALTGGNMLYHAALASPKTLETADKISFPIGALVVHLD